MTSMKQSEPISPIRPHCDKNLYHWSTFFPPNDFKENPKNTKKCSTASGDKKTQVIHFS